MPGGVKNMKGDKQMIYKNITFKAAPFSYDLTFDDRITLVGGDSGTGKTVLYEMLEDIRLTAFITFSFLMRPLYYCYFLFLKSARISRLVS